MNTTPLTLAPHERPLRRLPRSGIPAGTVLNLGAALVVAWLLPLAAIGRLPISVSDLGWLSGAGAVSLALLFSRWFQPHIDDRDLDVILTVLVGVAGLWLVGTRGIDPRGAHLIGGLLLSAGWLFATLGTRATMRLWPAAWWVVACLVPGLESVAIAGVGALSGLVIAVLLLIRRGWATPGQLVPAARTRRLMGLAYLVLVVGIARVLA